jgi:uncharacterized membrane protein YccC
VRRPSQQSISSDPRGNSESILLTSFVVLERILGVGDNVIRMMPLKLNSKHQKPVLRNRVWMASSYSNRTPERGNTTSHSYRSQTKFPQLDYKAWGYALRATCAACLALYISFTLNLDGSNWAFTTCFIIGAERQNGRVLAKSVARIVGTLIGAAASFTFVNAFSQERVLFLSCFTIWLSICAFFSHSQRGHWAYAWVLSAYTTAIVGIPAALAPDQAFDVVCSRAENIIIGILCMGTITMIASPESVRPLLERLVIAMDQKLGNLLSNCLSLQCDRPSKARLLAGLAANAVSIEDFRHGFVFEETGSGFSRANLGRFQLQCLGVAEASSSLDAHLRPIRHLLESGELPYLHEALERSRQAVVRSFHSLKHLQTSPVCQRLDEQLRQLLISARVDGLTYHCESPDSAELVGLFKLSRLLVCLTTYFETRSALFAETPQPLPSLPAKITTSIDFSVAAKAVLRVCGTIGTASLFWIATAWPAGDTFLIWATIACTQSVITPDPARATDAKLRGMLPAALPAYIITFYLLPAVDGFAMFVLVLLPFVFVGAGIGASLGRNGEVTAAMIVLMNGMEPANEITYDVVVFFNNVSAIILGVGIVCVTHRLIFPSTPSHRKLAATRQLLRLTVRSITQRKVSDAEYLGRTVRTATDVFALSAQNKERDRMYFAWAVEIWELAYELVNLRSACEDAPSEIAHCGAALALAIANFLRQPSKRLLTLAVSVSEKGRTTCLEGLATTQPNSSSANPILSIAAGFMAIRYRLNEQKTYLPLFTVRSLT